MANMSCCRRVSARRQLLSVAMRRRALHGRFAALAPALWPASSAASSPSFGPCAKAPRFSCATLPVPLDRTGRLAGTISLKVERRLAGRPHSKTPSWALAGWTRAGRHAAGRIHRHRRSPRAGARAICSCRPARHGRLRSAEVRRPRGRRRGAPHPARSDRALREANSAPLAAQYTTSDSSKHIEALRKAAGYEKLVLYGTSYEIKVALEYAERYRRTSNAQPHSKTPSGGREAFLVLSSSRAMTPSARRTRSRRACAGVSANPVADVAALVQRMDRAPLQGVAYGPRGKPVRLRMSVRDLYAFLLGGDVNPALRAYMPAAVHAALANDPHRCCAWRCSVPLQGAPRPAKKASRSTKRCSSPPPARRPRSRGRAAHRSPPASSKRKPP